MTLKLLVRLEKIHLRVFNKKTEYNSIVGGPNRSVSGG